jgi:hypothetical protein
MAKIFGIGLERTGTVTLANMMTRLGYRSYHMPRTSVEIEQHEFVNDITVACRFEDLDKLYPGSKFILTTRDEESWLDSCARHYDGLDSRSVQDFTGMAAAKIIYGTHVFSPELWALGRKRHHEFIRAYFLNRPDDLLVLDVRTDRLGKLLNFLPFSHDNIGEPWPDPDS